MTPAFIRNEISGIAHSWRNVDAHDRADISTFFTCTETPPPQRTHVGHAFIYYIFTKPFRGSSRGFSIAPMCEYRSLATRTAKNAKGKRKSLSIVRSPAWTLTGKNIIARRETGWSSHSISLDKQDSYCWAYVREVDTKYSIHLP